MTEPTGAIKNAPERPRQKLAVLAGDILQDVQTLVEQEVSLAKLQFFDGWGMLKPFAAWLAVGAVAAVSTGVLFTFTFVFVLHEITGLGLWACFGIADTACLAISVLAFVVVRAKRKELRLKQ